MSKTFDFTKLGKYFSALSNEANLKSTGAAWLIFGIRDIGGNYFIGQGSKEKDLNEVEEKHLRSIPSSNSILYREKKPSTFEPIKKTKRFKNGKKSNQIGRDVGFNKAMASEWFDEAIVLCNAKR